MCTSGAVKQSCWKEKGSNGTQSKNDACSTKRKPHKLKPDEPVNPEVHTAICLKLSDDGHIGNPDCLGDRERPRGRRLGHELGATGRQYYRSIAPVSRDCEQAARTLSRGFPRCPPPGDHDRRWLSRCGAGDARGPDNSPH